MAIEIEKKFLVKNKDWIKNIVPNSYIYKESIITQGYVYGAPFVRVRIEVGGADFRFFSSDITLKSDRKGESRREYIFNISDEIDAEIMIEDMCKGFVVKKHRHTFKEDGNRWEIDVFKDKNDGLIIAEIELKEETSTSSLSLPSWIGEEVTNDDRYYNYNLAKNGYQDWR